MNTKNKSVMTGEIVTEKAIEDYIKEGSSFSFEMKVLNIIENINVNNAPVFKTEFCGTYEDPITKASREFDIRVKYCYPKGWINYNVYLSVECKLLTNKAPLIIHAIPQREDQSYQDYIYHTFTAGKDAKFQYGKDSFNNIFQFENMGTYKKMLYLRRICSGLNFLRKEIYHVGQSMDQIYYKGNEIKCSDSDVYNKMSQAINSSYDLIKEAVNNNVDENIYAIIPILVIPDDTLFVVQYDNKGEYLGITKEKYVQYSWGKTWSIPFKTELRVDKFRDYTIAHLEIVTDGYLKEYLSEKIIYGDTQEGHVFRDQVLLEEGHLYKKRIAYEIK